MLVHPGMFHRHERSIDDDTQRYEQVDEGIHDKQLDNVREFVPTRTAFPAEQQVNTLRLDVFLQHSLLAEYSCDLSDSTPLNKR